MNDDANARRRWIADHIDEWIASVRTDAAHAIIDYQRQFVGKERPTDYNEKLYRLADLLEPDAGTMPSYDAEAIAQLDFSALKKPKTEK